MTEAIFGLIGVVIGALVTGGVTYALARRQESVDMRAGLRLVGEEYKDLLFVVNLLVAWLEEVADNPIPPSAWGPWRGVSTRQWEQHRALLAARLSPADWDLITNGKLAHQVIQALQDVPSPDASLRKSGLDALKEQQQRLPGIIQRLAVLSGAPQPQASSDRLGG
ncbi:MAG: hypothetical protein ACRDWG_04985 [Actinomycetes bacterium]|jgi:hypothetical protein